MKKSILIFTLLIGMVLFMGIGTAKAYMEAQYPGSVMLFPYYNHASGFQSYVVVEHQDVDATWGTSATNPNVLVRFNPKCGRGEALSLTLTTKQTLVVSPPADAPDEGWVEVYIRDDISDWSADDDWPLNGVVGILDITNGIAYVYKMITYYEEVWVDGSNDPIAYYDHQYWGVNQYNPIVTNLWRHSDFGRTMIVLLDPNGHHVSDCASNTFISNSAQLDIYSKSETDAHKTLFWCDGDDAGEPGIITVGVGTTDGPLGTTDDMISNPLSTSTDAAYGFGYAYNLRTNMWLDFDLDGAVDAGTEDFGAGCTAGDEHHVPLLGVSITRVSNDMPATIDTHRMDYLWLTY